MNCMNGMWVPLLCQNQGLQEARAFQTFPKGVVDKIRRARVFGARKLFFVKIDQLPLNRVALHGEVRVPIGRELFLSALDYLGVIAVGEFTDRLLGYRRILFRRTVASATALRNAENEFGLVLMTLSVVP